MKVSLNWVRFLNQKYHSAADPAPDGVENLVEKIGAQLGAVEEVIDLGKKYQGILIVKVVECVKHPNADKLSLCIIDDGVVNKTVKRNNDELVQVVCGAPNVRAGMLAVWIPPGAAVPSTYDKDPFVIEARPIRNKTSHGMLASPKELALGDNHEGILEIDQDIKPGASFAEACGLNDTIIDIENKMFTHRPDLFGQLGIARELAGINGQVFKSPDWYREDAGLKTDGRSNGFKLEVKNDLPKLVPRFCAVAVKDVRVAESPLWLKVRLTAVGIKPINNIVDVTNFYMMETAQPLHAYDADKVKTGVLGARFSRKGEELKLLGGKVIKLDEPAVVITDGRRPIGLGGIMGGADTEVDETTKNIILECANFDMNQTRKTAMHYGLFTDAATRFTKNQSPHQNRAVIAKAAEDILRVAGGRVASQLVDVKSRENHEKSVKIDIKFINSRLGLDLSAAEIKKLLSDVEFEVKAGGDQITVTAPFWRTDIEIPEDIVEEVGRLYGYDKLPLALPKRDLAPAAKDDLLQFKSKIRDILSRAGANEVLTYSFVHESLLKKTGQDPAGAYHIRNALSPDLQYYRYNPLPSLLEKIHPNIKLGYSQFAIFEIGKGHDKAHLGKDGLPMELETLTFVYASEQKAEPAGAAFFQAKNHLMYLARELGVPLIFTPVDKLPDAPRLNVFEPARTAMIENSAGKYLGTAGELRSEVRRQLKLPEYTAAFELDLPALLDSLTKTSRYQPLPRFPETYQDLCLRTKGNLTYQRQTDFIKSYIGDIAAEHGYIYELEPLDIYVPDGGHKQTTWRIHLWHSERTLTTAEVNKLMDTVAARARQGFNAERI